VSYLIPVTDAALQSALDDYEKRYKSPELTYTDGAITRIDYSDSTYKTLTWSAGLLSQIDHVRPTLTTIRKVFSYTDGILQSVTETEI
jgi:hypothetical protein